MSTNHYTQCPECHAVFRVTDEQLDIALGKVRCGHCMEVFQADDHFTEAPFPETLPPEPAPSPHEIASDKSVESKPNSPAQATVPPGTEAARPIPMELAEDLAAAVQPGRGKHGFIWGLGILLLLLTLTGQYAYFNRHELIRYKSLQPHLYQMCQLLKCNIRMQRDLDAIRLISRNVMSHPRNSRVLLIQASFMSTAAQPQPYPTLEVKLSNSSGQTIAMRRFKPPEYIESASEIKRGMTPDVPVSLLLEVLKPKQDVNAFFFDFL